LLIEPGESLRFEHRRDVDPGLAQDTLVRLPQSLLEVSNGTHVRYGYTREPLNAALGTHPIAVDGADWAIEPPFITDAGTVSLDAGLSTESLNAYSPEGFLLSARYQGEEAQIIHLAFYDDVFDSNEFRGVLYLNGIEIGALDPYGATLDPYGKGVLNEIRVDGQTLDFFSQPGEQAPSYVVSLPVEPHDILTLRLQRASWS
jgi:hypothetical protein